EFLSRFNELNDLPSREEALSQKEGKFLSLEAHSKQEALKKEAQSLREAKSALEKASPEEKQALQASYNAQKSVVKHAKSELKHAEKTLESFVKHYRDKIRYAPRRERWDAFKKALQAKYEFRMECISAYKETRYSANKKALKMLEEVGITEPKKRLKQYPFEHSGGMLQRCMIAMALVERPDILIADEPTTALDVTIQAQILELIKKLQKGYGMAIIIITHDLGVVAQICDEVAIMYAGRIVERGNVDDVFYNPQHEYTKGLLKSMPKLDQKEKLEPIQGNPVDLFCLPKGCAFSSRCKQCMEICIEKYPEEVLYDETGHAASCWKMIQKLHEEGKIDLSATPEGKPLVYNGAIIAQKKKGGKKNG
ncbi:MAG: ATP-binding cassette domain-containing protein, partial [Bacilli bacterium]|nr:ATP-binding cassette domain-containing protein [Bacilli bacterium]